MLLSVVNFAGSVCEDSVYDPWNLILPEGYGVVVNDLKKAYDVGVVRQKGAGDTSERWYGLASVEFSVFGEISGQQSVRIPIIFEIEEVEYLPQAVSVPQMPSTGCSAKGPAKGKRKRSETSSPVAIKRQFEFADESVVLPKGRGVYFDDPNFAIALKDEDKTVSFRRSGRSRRAAPVF